MTSAAIDAYRIGRAVCTDSTRTRRRRPGKRTIKAAASVVSGRTGSYLGGVIDTLVGTVFGGTGAVLCGIIVGVVGSYAGGCTAEKVVDRYVSSDSEGEDEEGDV